MKFYRLGERHMLINLEQKVDPVINDQCVALVQSIQALDLKGILHVANAYCSIKVSFSPEMISYDKLKSAVSKLTIEKEITIQRRLMRVPVCYNFENDLSHLSGRIGLSIDEIVELHVSKTYRVYMLGFLLGFPYLGSLDKRLSVPRKEQPVKWVAKGSVGIAENQTGIYPTDSASGWHIIGRTPLDLINSKDASFYFSNTDEVKFYPITIKEFMHWDKNA